MNDPELLVLGGLLVGPSALPVLTLEEGLRAEHFATEDRRAVFAAMVALDDEGDGFDRTTVVARLKGKPGAVELVEVLAAPPGAAHLRRYARLVRDASMDRALRLLAEQATSALSTGTPPRDVLLALERGLAGVGEDAAAKQPRAASDVMADVQERVAAIAAGRRDAGGIPSGFAGLDDLLGGFRPGNMIVVAARPAMGKSAFVTNVADYVAARGLGVGFFTLEMTDEEVAERLVAAETNIRGDDIRRGQVRPDQLKRVVAAGARMAGRGLWIDDTGHMTVTELRAKARRLHQKHGLDLVIVDYLQLLHGERGQPRIEVVSEASRALKALAKELGVPVLALSQLSRALETRGTSPASKRPILSDLRESGQIEQDADIVAFLFREEYYDPDTDRKGVTDVIVAKHRGGRIGEVELMFDAAHQRFTDKPPADRPAPMPSWGN